MNKFEKRSRDSYNKKAEGYDDTPEGRFTARFNRALLDAVEMKNGDAVLDVACGNGRLLAMFADRCAIDGYGADISDRMIEQARRLNPSMHFDVCACDRLPYADRMFDRVTVCAAYHHFPNVGGFAKEAFRVLKGNGRIYIAEVYYPPVLMAICNPFLPLLRSGDVRFYPPNEIVKTLGGAGFQSGRYETGGSVQIVSARKG